MAISTFCGLGQQNSSTALIQRAGCLNFINSLSNVAARYRALRAIEDRGTHQHWLLLEDLSHPTAPALLLQAPRDLFCAPPQPTKIDSRFAPSVIDFSFPVIHAGDSIILSEHTQILDAELEATALKGAAVGDPLTVRLKFGGRILHAVANSPGRATLAAVEKNEAVH